MNTNVDGIEVEIDLQGIEGVSLIDSETAGRIMKKWSALLRNFLDVRFTKFSRGGGDWAPLSPVTIARKRAKASKRGKGRSQEQRMLDSLFDATSILIDTGVLRTALNAHSPGSITRELFDANELSVEVGIGGSSKHPSSKNLTIGQIASLHQYGGKNMPARPIVVKPDQSVIEEMKQIAIREIKRAKTS